MSDSSENSTGSLIQKALRAKQKKTATQGDTQALATLEAGILADIADFDETRLAADTGQQQPAKPANPSCIFASQH